MHQKCSVDLKSTILLYVNCRKTSYIYSTNSSEMEDRHHMLQDQGLYDSQSSKKSLLQVPPLLPINAVQLRNFLHTGSLHQGGEIKKRKCNDPYAEILPWSTRTKQGDKAMVW